MSDETNDVSLGIRGATSTANLALVVTGQTTQNTAVAFPASFKTCVLIGDGTTLRAWDVDLGTQIGVDAAQVNAAATAGHLKMLCTNTAAASNTFRCDDIAVLTEAAA